MSSNLAGNSLRRKCNWKKWLGLSALLLASACLVAVILFWWHVQNWEMFTATNYYPLHPGSAALSSIEGNADIVLPPSAHEIHAYTTGLNEIDVLVRFAMSADDLDEFMKSTLCQEPLAQMNYEQRTVVDQVSEWWTPGQAEHLEGCTGSKDHIYQRIMVDMTQPDIYIVFVSVSIG